MIIAIDGPVASGKSAVGKRLAARLGYLFFDTGVLYRAVTCLAVTQFGPTVSAEIITTIAHNAAIDVRPPTLAESTDGRDCTVFAEGGDLTWAIRAPEVEGHVSRVAAIPAVRTALTEHMRRIGLRGNVVMVGRDIGTVVLPEADLKIFLTASVEARAQRRFVEVQARGETRTYADILDNLRQRDQQDSARAVAPLRQAADALLLDTTALDLPGTLAALEDLVRQQHAA